MAQAAARALLPRLTVKSTAPALTLSLGEAPRRSGGNTDLTSAVPLTRRVALGNFFISHTVSPRP